MARPLRIQFENACYHVTCRGNARETIFLDDFDRQEFIRLLARSAEVYQVDILAFILMPNHFHLIVRTPLANLQEFMRHFNISYTARFNKLHTRAGHLYQGRYKSFLIDADSYLLEASRYVHLNPVRMEDKTHLSPEEKRSYLRNYPWSSYIDYINEEKRHGFIFPDEILSHFSGRREGYAEFVENGMELNIDPLDKGKELGVLGDISFVESVKRHHVPASKREQPAARRIVRHVEPQKILRTVAGSFQVPLQQLLRKGYVGVGRSIAMEMLYRYGGMNQREIGELMGIDYSSVSVARKRLENVLKTDTNVAQQTDIIKEQLRQALMPERDS